jgi:hypothetical protein
MRGWVVYMSPVTAAREAARAGVGRAARARTASAQQVKRTGTRLSVQANPDWRRKAG